MTTRTINGKHLHIQKLAKKISDSNNIPTKVPSTPPLESVQSTVSSIQHFVTRTEVTPKTRIVVVRTSSRAQSDDQESEEIKQAEESDAVQIPAVFTDGRTSVYLIRRPIPPPEPPRQTRLYKVDGDGPPQITTTNTTTTTAANTTRTVHIDENGQLVMPPASTEDSVTSPSQVHSSVTRTETSKHRSSLTNVEDHEQDSFDVDPSEKSQTHITSPTQTGHIERNNRRRRRSRPRPRPRSRSSSRSRSRTTDQNDLDSRARSASRRRQRVQHRISPTTRSPSPSLVTDQKESKNNDGKKNYFSFSKTKSTSGQANVIPSETILNERRTGRKIRSSPSRSSKRRITPTPRVKSSKSIVLVNPHDQTIAVVENPYVKGSPLTSIIKVPIPASKKHRFLQTNDEQYERKSSSKSQGSSCLDCLSRNICLIIAICITLFIIGLAGAGVSAYFLATDSQSNFIPKIVGAVVGGVLAIASMCFLCCLLGCIGSHEGYFTYSDAGRNSGGRAFALIPSNHRNAHLYSSTANRESHRANQASSSNRSNGQLQVVNRQISIVNETNNTTNAKNIIIEMPERLLTAKENSSKSREMKMNNVVANVNRVVEHAKKRYNGDVPTKVIVTVDENAKPKT